MIRLPTLAQLEAEMIRRGIKYSPDQPRDEAGRWTEVGGGAGGEGASVPPRSYWTPPSYNPDGSINYDRPEVFHTNDIDQAIAMMRAGVVVELQEVRQVNTLIQRLAQEAEAAIAAGTEAKPINLCNLTIKGTNLFCAERHLSGEYPRGVPRIEMPQLNGVPEQGSEAQTFPRSLTNPKKVDGSEPFMAHLRALGIPVENGTIPAAKLKASQAELNGMEVARFATRPDFNKEKYPIFVSRDNYVIDGHHRWAGIVAREAGTGTLGTLTMNVRKIDAPITEVLHLAQAWTERVGLRRQRFGQPRSAQKYREDQPRDEHGRWTDAGNAAVVGGLPQLLQDIAAPDGGFTYSPLNKTKPITGYALSVYKGREQALPLNKITPMTVAQYAKANWDLLSKSNNYLGAWHNPANDQVYLDVSTVVKTPEEAQQLGRQHHQLAYFDLKKGQSVSLTRSYHGTAPLGFEWLDGFTAYLGRSLGLLPRSDGQGTNSGRDRRDEADPLAYLKFREDQPRVPAGSPEGGQWTSGDSVGSGNKLDPRAGKAEDYPVVNPHGITTKALFTYPDGTWEAKRQALHELARDSEFVGKTPVDRATVYWMGGGSASGKSTFKELGLMGPIPENTVMNDPDRTKERWLPEFHDSTKGAGFVHDESSEISASISQKAGKEGYNMLFDGVGDNTIESLKAKVDLMRQHGQRTVAHYLTVPIEVALQRNEDRYNKLKAQGRSPRKVNPNLVIDGHRNISLIFPKIVSEGVFDHITLWDTNVPEGSKPTKIAQGRGRTLTIYDQAKYDAFLAKAQYGKGLTHDTDEKDAGDHSGDHSQWPYYIAHARGTPVLCDQQKRDHRHDGPRDHAGYSERVGGLKYSEDQPRVPAGSPEGGQFQSWSSNAKLDAEYEAFNRVHQDTVEEFAKRDDVTDKQANKLLRDLGKTVGSADTNGKEALMEDLLDDWSISSGDSLSTMIAQQRVVNDYFKLNAPLEHFEDASRPSRVETNQIVEKALGNKQNVKVFEAAVSHQYQTTQEWLKDNKIEEIVVARGLRGIAKLDRDSEVSLQPLSSWSFNGETGTNFGAPIPDGQTMVMRVKANKVFGLVAAGTAGTLREKEIVVLGGKHTVKVFHRSDYSTHVDYQNAVKEYMVNV